MRLFSYLTKNQKKREEVFRLIIRPDFEEKIQAIREKHDIPVDDLEIPTPENESAYLHFSESSSIRNEALALIKQFKISENWLDLLITHIVCNQFVPSGDMDPDGLILEVDLETNSSTPKKYLLHLNSETTLDEIKKAWPTIKKQVRAGRYRRKKPWKNFWRDYEIYSLASRGKTITEIDMAIQLKFKGQNLDYGNIKHIESDFRKKLGIPKKYRKNKLKTH
jgi:hypothetical protein